MNKKWTLLSGLLASVVMVGSVGMANAADWKPTKPIELIAPAGPGGGWDLLARSMQKALTEEKLVSQPVLVTNKPGGGGATGTTFVSSSVASNKGSRFGGPSTGCTFAACSTNMRGAKGAESSHALSRTVETDQSMGASSTEPSDVGPKLSL